uniref:Major facilitator superfamily (MFS) profile domain-containing protein n=1 Tax=Pinguiococcus pyrenoidosus TaxID=172671 RepID=A0A7R9YD98_9STRA
MAGLFFAAFSLFIASFSVGDVAMASLLTQCVSNDKIGRILGLKVTLDSCARIVAPVVTSSLFQMQPSLPFICGAGFPLLGSALPLFLWTRKRKADKGNKE